MPAIPITILTGFLGSGKTTLILNLIPQLPKDYKLALLKNEFGDLAIDSQLASSSAIAGVQELLNGCICCNLVGQLGDALDTLRNDVKPDRIIVETSGSAFPATLAMEVNRLGRESGNYTLDGVIVVIDVENWQGYDDTSYTAKMQARFTDLIVFNKWEHVSDRKYEDCLDRVGDLELQVAHVKSDKGRVDEGVLLGLDSALAKKFDLEAHVQATNSHSQVHPHGSNHQSEVEVLSVTLRGPDGLQQGIDLECLESFLLSTPKDEVYRIKAVLWAIWPAMSSDGNQPDVPKATETVPSRYILNWAFGRWTFTATNLSLDTSGLSSSGKLERNGNKDTPEALLRMTIICARYEATKWKKKLEGGTLIRLSGSYVGEKVHVERLS